MKNNLDYLDDYYGKRLSVGGSIDYQLGWENTTAHYERFRVLTRELEVNYRKVLDVGAGLGDLWHHLALNGNITDYLGVDILPAMVNRARVRFPEVHFECCDVITSPACVNGPFDIVYSAGIFNLAQTSGMSFLKLAFDAFSQLSGEYIVISLLNVSSLDREDMYCYFDPLEVKRELARHDWELRTVEGYLHNDFTLIARRVDRLV